MTVPALVQFANSAAESFYAGQSYYGDIGICPELFSSYLWSSACRHLKHDPDELIVVELAKTLYARDLYLVCGCVYNSEKAWAVFDSRYRRFIANLVRLCYRPGTDIEEISDSLMVGLYFNDRSGRQRIGSYDGRSSLATWLRVIVINRAINENSDRIITSKEGLTDIQDCQALANLESALLADRYNEVVCRCLALALRETTAKERLMLLWRYDQNLQLGEIAHLMGIHQSNVTRQLLRIQSRLRTAVVETLRSQYQMGPSAIQECLDDVIDNPQISVSLISLIKEMPSRVTAANEAIPPLGTELLPRMGRLTVSRTTKKDPASLKIRLQSRANT